MFEIGELIVYLCDGDDQIQKEKLMIKREKREVLERSAWVNREMLVCRTQVVGLILYKKDTWPIWPRAIEEKASMCLVGRLGDIDL